MSTISYPFQIFDSLDSTNNYAMGKVREGLWKHSNAAFSYEQTAGKGTRGKHWQSNKRENIILSIVADTSFLDLNNKFYLAAITALSCFDLFSKYARESITIKWPNDLFWNDRKAAGILIENAIRGNKWQSSVIGIGMNINQTLFNNEIIKPVSLKQITGKTYDILLLAEELYNCFFERYESLKRNKFSEIMEEYNLHLFRRNEISKLKKGPAVFESTIVRVSADGMLHTSDVTERTFDFNEVKWLL